CSRSPALALHAALPICRRLEQAGNVELRAGALESLPIEDGALDAAVLMLVLHHLADPLQALREAVRALRPGGRLLVVDMAAHTRSEEHTSELQSREKLV